MMVMKVFDCGLCVLLPYTVALNAIAVSPLNAKGIIKKMSYLLTQTILVAKVSMVNSPSHFFNILSWNELQIAQ